MTVTTTASSATATGNGATTSFPFNFAIRSANGVAVYLNGVLQTGGYSVTPSSDMNGGTVTFAVAPASGVAILLASSPSFMQDISFDNTGSYDPATVDDIADDSAVRDIYLLGALSRTLQLPIGESTGVLPSASQRKGGYLGFDASGNPIVQPAVALTGPAGAAPSTRISLEAITGQVSGQAAYLAEAGRQGWFIFDSTNISANVSGGFAYGDTQQGIYVLPASDTTGASGAWVRKYTGPLDVRWFGVLANSNGTTGNGNDDTTAFQAAVNAAAALDRALLLPARGIVRLTAPITCASGIAIIGHGTNPYKGMLNTGSSVRDVGSWLYFDHTGKGLSFSGASPISGVHLRHFGTIRNQPALGVGWTPTANDFDIYLRSCECFLHDLTLLNATKGISADQGDYGKFTASYIRGQFMQVGIQIDKQYDVAFIDHFRNWAYWADDANVELYQEANCDSIYCLRVDNPQFSNIFSIRHRAGIRIGQSATSGSYTGGTTSKLKVSNFDADIGKYGLWVDSTVTSGAQVSIANFSAQCNNLTGSVGVLVQGQNSRIAVTHTSIIDCDQNAVSVTGSGSVAHFTGDVSIINFNAAAGGYSAFNAASGTTIELDGVPSISGGGAGAAYGGSGTILTPDWRSWSPTITPSSGSFTTVTINQALYRHSGNRVDIDLEFTLTSIGTGTGQINVPLPVTASGDVVLPGYLATVGSGMVMAVGGPGATSAILVKYDSSSAIAANELIRVTGSYNA